jgi:large subunit ribosomal protein L29
MSLEELKIKLRDDMDALQNLRFQKSLQQLENPVKIRMVKREIARVKTILHEYEMDIREK